MADKSQRPKGRDGILLLDMAIDGLNLAKELSSIIPAKAVFGPVSVLFTMIRASFVLFCEETFQAHMRPGHNDQ